VGEVFSTYIIAEQGDRLLIIDKHAAHERIVYERLLASRISPPSQVLLTPLTVTMTSGAASALIERAGWLAHMGFDVEDFGPSSLLVRAIPSILGLEQVSPTLDELAEKIIAGRREPEATVIEELLYSVACKGAVRAGAPTKRGELEVLVRDVLTLPNIHHCPHGRPVLWELTKAECDKRFGR